LIGLLSLDECGPQRPHADYTRESLEKIMDDGFCGGAPLGVVSGLQPNTVFDMWPGAINWDVSRFYEHKQPKLGPGDAVFFLGNAVHAGSAFEKENARLHCYLDVPDVQREPNTTCFMDMAAGVGNILPRGVKLP
jgi:ectoine hydroxylase-related dioxygenase (phytanoyl-CoA dioxygenase family)